MLNKIRNKVASSKKLISRQFLKSSSSKQKPTLHVFASILEKARYHEKVEDWGGAAFAWEEHIQKFGVASPSRISDLIEFAFAMLKVYEQSGIKDPFGRPDLRNVSEEILSSILKDEVISLGRPSLFKGVDLLILSSNAKLVPLFLLAAGIDPENDTELREKVILEYLRVSSTHRWVWDDDIVRQRIDVFNNVIIDYCIKNSERDHLSLFFSVKRYATECLAAGRQPTVKHIRHVVLNRNSIEGEFEPIIIHDGANKLSAFLDHSFADIVSSLAFFHPSVILDIAATTDTDEKFERAIKRLAHLVPRYCVITKLGYPMGGGESFMHQSCAILREFGFENIWISFTDKDGIPYSRETVVNTPYYRDVRLAGGLSESAVVKAIGDYAVDLLHTQGISNEIVARCAKKARIPCFAGFHFWNGLVDLGYSKNRNILGNSRHHEMVEVVKGEGDTLRYVASEFMADVYRAVGGSGQLEVFHPVPDPSHFGVNDSEREKGVFVTQINLAEGKGGRIFLACLETLGCEGIPFLGVHSETVEDGLLSKISSAVSKAPKSRLETYGPAKSIYARSKIVIVPTLVDETFCRVAFEAAANGIPVLSTRAGFIPYMLGDVGVYLPEDDNDVWINEIRALYSDSARIAEIGRRQQEHVLKHFGKYPAKFLDAVLHVASEKLHRKNIGFFTAWSDQGLGYQVRHYSHLLREAGFRTHIFSFLPYKAIGSRLTIQSEKGDWESPQHADTVYYSYNDREHVPASEVSQFVRANRVGALIYPEICWDINWRMVEQLSVPGLFVIGVPNLEIVRKGEALLHGTALSRTFCPTRAVEQVLYSHGVRNTHYIGHGFGEVLSESAVTEKINRMEGREYINFLHIGGHNPKSRKQTPYVIEAFLLALRERSDIRLTVTVMDTQNIEFPQHENINYIIGSIGHTKVMDLYKACDVSIQVSSHEGVGMGFYESLANGTPVISLDVPPHNEVVLHRLTGWLLRAALVPLPDNDDPVSRAARFEVDELAQLIVSLEKADVAAMIRSAAKVHRERFDDISLKLRLLEALP